MNHINKLKMLTGSNFWTYVLANKEELIVKLDNDSTIVVSAFEDEEDEGYAEVPDCIGYGDGICNLLSALNINFEYV